MKDNQKGSAVLVLLAILLLVLLSLIGYFVFQSNSKTENSKNPKIATTNQAKSKTADATAITPLGQPVNGSGVAVGLEVKILKVTTNPKTTDATPKNGMQFVEVDFSIKNNSKNSFFIPGDFYYQTSEGKLLNNDGVIQDEEPNIDTELIKLSDSSKQALVAAMVDPGDVDTSYYLLYEIPKGDNGKLVWYDRGESSRVSDRTKLATFNLQ